MLSPAIALALTLLIQAPGQSQVEGAKSAGTTGAALPDKVPQNYDEVGIRKQLDAILPKPADIKPEPLPEIPHAPAPHEGHMLDYPRRISPPDLLVVEVLEALPGRPITGERLVRPDGTICLDFYGDIHVRGLTTTQAKAKILLHLRQYINDESLGLVGNDPDTQERVFIKPEDSSRVVVNITAYNSAVYYIQGEVHVPGRLPCTGNDTVLDAINYAGGLTPEADPSRFKLIRPDRDGHPARVFSIDLEGITERGDSAANLQLFPGDRLFVGGTPEPSAEKPQN